MKHEIEDGAIAILLKPYMLEGAHIPLGLYRRLTQYLQLLLKWNARMNLTALRDPSEIVTRHFGESIFAAQHLGECRTLLDFGSGAGFPGLPIQLMRTDILVTVAESQNKKATFLREVVRSLDLKATVWSGRVEAMPAVQQFDVVTLRAVDHMEAAIGAASPLAGKKIMLLSTPLSSSRDISGFTKGQPVAIPGAKERSLISFTRQS